MSLDPSFFAASAHNWDNRGPAGAGQSRRKKTHSVYALRDPFAVRDWPARGRAVGGPGSCGRSLEISWRSPIRTGDADHNPLALAPALALPVRVHADATLQDKKYR